MIGGVALAALSALPVLAAPSYVLTLGARAELDLREPGSPDSQARVREHSWDAIGDLGARLSVGFRRVQLGIGYLPRLALMDFTGQPVRDVLHVGEASVGWSFRRGHLAFTERASYGDRSFAALTMPTAATANGALLVQSLPQAVSVRYVSSDSALTSQVQTSARTQLTTTVSYLVAGGADDASRAYVPLVRGPRAYAGMDYSAGRRDGFLTSVDATSLTTSLPASDVRAETIRAGEQWRHQWTPRTNSQVGAGVALVPGRGDARLRTFPTASLLLHQSVPTGPRRAVLDLTASAGVDVFIDRLTGLVDQRGTATFVGSWALAPVTLHVMVGRSESLRSSQPNGLRITFGEAGVSCQLLQPLALEGGVRVFDQTLDSPTTTTPLYAAAGRRWIGFAALVYQSQPVSL